MVSIAAEMDTTYSVSGPVGGEGVPGDPALGVFGSVEQEEEIIALTAMIFIKHGS